MPPSPRPSNPPARSLRLVLGSPGVESRLGLLWGHAPPQWGITRGGFQYKEGKWIIPYPTTLGWKSLVGNALIGGRASLPLYALPFHPDSTRLSRRLPLGSLPSPLWSLLKSTEVPSVGGICP